MAAGAMSALDRVSAPDLWTAADAALWAGNAAGGCVAANPALCSLTGYSEPEFRAIGLASLLEDAAGFERLYGALWAGGAAFAVSGRLRAKDGRLLPVRLSVARLEGRGEPLALCTVASCDDLAILSEAFSGTLGIHLAQSIVASLGRALPAECVLAGRLAGPSKERVETVALCWDGQIIPGTTYELENTPCAHVVRGKSLCLYESGIRAMFPQDEMLVTMGANAYAGTPLVDSLGRVLGILAAVSVKPFPNPERAKLMLAICAGRLSAELERMRIDERAMDRFIPPL